MPESKMGCEGDRGRIFEGTPGNSGSGDEAGGKRWKGDAADAHLIAHHDGQHPCSLFVLGFPPRLRGSPFLQLDARLLVRR